MERTLSGPERLTEFGPNPFVVDEQPPAESVEGKRPRTLKAGVIAQCENVAGVYGFLDEHGVLTYVGKSKQLRTRLLGYFSPKLRRKKPGQLIRQARGILWEPAPTEFAALLRELQLIQHWRPRFNVKDLPLNGRATYLGLGRPTAPGVLLTSKPAADGLATFGPLWMGKRLSRAVDALNRLFSLRDCENSQPMAFSDQSEPFEKPDRPGCLRFELGTCLGPCLAACSEKAYFQNVQKARRFLEGKNERAFRSLLHRMNEAAANRQFEIAARQRDDLAALTFLQNRLAQIRKIEKEYHFIYPSRSAGGETIWYLIRGGRIAAVTRPPSNRQNAKVARERIRQTYEWARLSDDLTTKRPDTLLLIASWFQRNPGELEKTLTPQEAKSRCRR